MSRAEAPRPAAAAALPVRVLRPAPYAALEEYCLDERRRRRDADTIRSREDELSSRPVPAPEAVGLRRFRAFEETLENGFGAAWRRARVQREFHDLCAGGLARLILGDDWDRDGPDLCAARGWRLSAHKLVICKTPRRFGKSVATAMVVAALAKCFVLHPPAGEELKVGCFSTGKRASSGLADYAQQLLAAAGVCGPFEKFNTEAIWIPAGSSSTVKIAFYPSNKKMSSALSAFASASAFLPPRAPGRLARPPGSRPPRARARGGASSRRAACGSAA
jgi:hypothetical protein